MFPVTFSLFGRVDFRFLEIDQIETRIAYGQCLLADRDLY
jgi:hypothetical protein